MKSIFKVITVAFFAFTALSIGALALFPSLRNGQQNREVQQPRVVIPRTLNAWLDYAQDPEEIMVRETLSARIPLGEGRVAVAVLNGNFYRSPLREQFVAYQNTLEPGSPIYLAFIGYDAASASYQRLWSAPTAATRPETVTLDTQDILGDRSVSVLLSGMNHLGEYTLTVFRLNEAEGAAERFTKIAEISIDGNITVREVARSQAYQMGIAPGQSFTIAAQGRDFDSDNFMDQIEIIYAHNPANGLFEERNRRRIPGAQIEQQRVRELLGNSHAFEEFIAGLWFYVTAQGTIDRGQFIYFDPGNRQIIFFDDDTMQVFSWRNSIATRQGIHITSQNVSISTIRRGVDIQLESLDSIRIRTTENLRPAFRTVAAPWDGSYRMAGRPVNAPAVAVAATPENAHIDARYDSAMGRIHFFPDGSFEIHAGGTVRQGNYVFFRVSDNELLEFRSNGDFGPRRETFLVEGARGEGETRQNFALQRVRLGAGGIEKSREGAIPLTPVEEAL